MIENLLSLIYNYSINAKLIDEEYIEKFIDIVVNSKMLDKYVCDLQILAPEDRLPKGCVSAYNYTYKTIYVDFNNTNKYLIGPDKYQILFDKDEQTFYKNSLISQAILHELEHANQYKLIDNEESLEAKILKFGRHNIKNSEMDDLVKKGYSIKDIANYILKRQIVYRDFYLESPLERLAEIKSHQDMIILLSNIKEIVPNLLDFEQATKIEALLCGFNYEEGKIISPTAFYLKKMGEEQALKEFDWYDEDYYKALEKSKTNYSLEDRLKYGLMIDENEFHRCGRTLMLSKKYNC